MNNTTLTLYEQRISTQLILGPIPCACSANAESTFSIPVQNKSGVCPFTFVCLCMAGLHVSNSLQITAHADRKVCPVFLRYNESPHHRHLSNCSCLHRLYTVPGEPLQFGCTENKGWLTLVDQSASTSIRGRLVQAANLCYRLYEPPLLAALLENVDTRQEPACFARKFDPYRFLLKKACWAASSLTVGSHQLSCRTHLLQTKPCTLRHKLV